MKRITLLTLLALLVIGLALFAGACGEDENGNGGNGGDIYSGVADEDLLQTLFVDALCDAAWSCTGDSHTVADLSRGLAGRYASVEECKSGIAEDGGIEVEDLSVSIEAGRLVLDRQHSGACKDDIVSQFCTVGFSGEEPSSCMQLVAGQVEEGGYCLDSSECAGDSWCRFDEECYGTCEELPGNCGDETCSADEFCDFEFVDGEFEDFCSPRATEGEACDYSEQCLHSLYCSPLSETCIPIEVKSAGEACHILNHFCEPGYRCEIEELDPLGDLEGECTPMGQAGETCHLDFECAAGLFCQQEVPGDITEGGTCRAPLSAGEECEDDNQCEGYCGFDPDICYDYIADGDACEFSYQCESYTCDDGVCFSREAEACEIPED